jgi:hypothetical protein
MNIPERALQRGHARIDVREVLLGGGNDMVLFRRRSQGR